jgi:hypothetical protein
MAERLKFEHYCNTYIGNREKKETKFVVGILGKVALLNRHKSMTKMGHFEHWSITDLTLSQNKESNTNKHNNL